MISLKITEPNSEVDKNSTSEYFSVINLNNFFNSCKLSSLLDTDNLPIKFNLCEEIIAQKVIIFIKADI